MFLKIDKDFISLNYIINFRIDKHKFIMQYGYEADDSYEFKIKLGHQSDVEASIYQAMMTGNPIVDLTDFIVKDKK